MVLMALRDELDKIVENNKPRVRTDSDEAAYQLLLKNLYEECIVRKIKEDVSKGKTNIEGEFGFELNSDVYREWSELYDFSVLNAQYLGNNRPKGVNLRGFYIYTEARFFKKERFELTPFGVKVYKDLKRLAQRDQVVLSEPIPETKGGVALGKGYTTYSMRIKFSYRYR